MEGAQRLKLGGWRWRRRLAELAASAVGGRRRWCRREAAAAAGRSPGCCPCGTAAPAVRVHLQQMHNLVGKPHTHKCHDHPLPMRCIATAQSSCRRTVCCAELSRPPLAAPARPIEPTRLGWLWFLRCPRSASSLSAHPLWLAQTFVVSIRSIVASHWSSDAEPLAGRAAAAAAAAAGRDGSLRNEKAAMSNFARSSREPPDRQLPNRKRNSGQHEGKLCGVSAS